MQTLKTAAIVVLLMTVMYGAYVSITTPPEPPPDELVGMLEEDLEIDDGFADSLGDIAMGDPVADGYPTDQADAEPRERPYGPNRGGGSSGPPSFAAAPPVPDSVAPSGVTGSLSDQAMTLGDSSAAGSSSGVGASAAGGDGEPAGVPAATASSDALGGERLASRGGVPGALPAVDTAAGEPQIDPDQDYPSTAGNFEMPDPAQAAKGFGSAGDAAAETSAETDNGGPGPTPSESNAGGEAESKGESTGELGFANALRTADELYHEGQKKEALATLSLFYEQPDLSAEDRAALVSRLDPLARDVIYSQAHLLEQPHRVRKNETLMEIAAEYEVPWQLLANINRIDDPVTVLPGTDLKVVRGPFRADVDLSEAELTLFLGDFYAGRFPVAIGNDPAPEPGSYTIQDKQRAKTYYDRNGSPVPVDDPKNPYGSMWLDLGGRLSIHGSPNKTEPTDKGCISLSGNHAADLRSILSTGSSVVIRP